MDFIREIHEARMTRSESNTKKLSYLDCCERAYLSLLILELLRQFPGYTDPAKKYAKNTSRYTGYDRYRINAPDLYNFLYFVLGNEEAMQKLRDSDDAWKIRQKTHAPEMAINRYLTQLASGKTPFSTAQFFIKIEGTLRIPNSYRSIRRTITNLDRLSGQSQIKKAATELLYAARARLRSSDIIDDLEKLAADRNLEKGGVDDKQPVISRSDQIFDNKDLLWLAKIVGQRRLFLAIKYIELQRQGKTIPSNVARAMSPAIEMIVEIITAGPTFIQRFLEIHETAKKANRRK
jgi:hypothetical protein